MPDISIMIEGQMGLNWPRWQRLVATVERLGFAGLFRSDHFTMSRPPDHDWPLRAPEFFAGCVHDSLVALQRKRPERAG